MVIDFTQILSLKSEIDRLQKEYDDACSTFFKVNEFFMDKHEKIFIRINAIDYDNEEIDADTIRVEEYGFEVNYAESIPLQEVIEDYTAIESSDILTKMGMKWAKIIRGFLLMPEPKSAPAQVEAPKEVKKEPEKKPYVAPTTTVVNKSTKKQKTYEVGATGLKLPNLKTDTPILL